MLLLRLFGFVVSYLIWVFLGLLRPLSTVITIVLFRLPITLFFMSEQSTLRLIVTLSVSICSLALSRFLFISSALQLVDFFIKIHTTARFQFLLDYMQIMAFVLKVLPTTTIQGRENRASLLQCRRCARNISRKQRSTIPLLSIVSQHNGLTILVNGCTGKMGNAVIEEVASKGIHLVPISFSRSNESGKIVQVGGKEIQLYGPSERESILTSAFEEYPNLMVVDYTVPASVNDNAELYCRVGVPFVMGTTGGDRERLYKTVEDSKVCAVISPQMGKQVVAFLASMEIMAEQFPGAFSGYSLEVMESHQASKLDTSGTAKAIVACFKKLGISFDG